MTKRPPALLWIIPTLALLLSGCLQGEMHVVDAWIPEAPPNVPVLAGYMTIENGTDESWSLIGARSGPFERVEMHRTLHDRETGLARMLPADQVTIAPGEIFVFQPNGYHLMLIHPESALKAGQMIPLTLVFSPGRDLVVEFEVRRNRPLL